MNDKWKWITAGRLRRGAVILGAIGLTAGAGLATAGSALAAVGTGPGQLQLVSGGTVITSGALTLQPTWQTTTACPSGNQGSAFVAEFDLSGNKISNISNIVSAVTSPFNGLLDGAVGPLLATGGVSATSPGTLEWVVECATGPTGSGTSIGVQDIWVTATAAGNFTVSNSPPAQIGTTTTLAVSPNTGVTTATTVNLTATVTDADSTTPAGTVTFFNNGTAINTSPITVTGGTASTSTTFPSAGTFAITAVFTPTSQTYAPSTSPTTNLTVTLAGSQTAGGTNPVVINVTVAATGTLTVTVAPGPANLTVAGLVGSGTLPNVTVKDTRNTFPGWSVMGQESAFTSSALPATPISGNQLGWAPAAATGSAAFDGTHVVLGPTVAPASPGLGTTAGVLALAHAGFGADPSGATSWIATAALTLDIPATTTAGAYTGNLTVTYPSAQA
jgi:Bacterial Ig-like domain (group 3)